MTDAAPAGSEADLGEPLAGPPRWVKVLAAIVLFVVLLFAVLKLTGMGGDHGPGRHGPGRHGHSGADIWRLTIGGPGLLR